MCWRRETTNRAVQRHGCGRAGVFSVESLPTLVIHVVACADFANAATSIHLHRSTALEFRHGCSLELQAVHQRVAGNEGAEQGLCLRTKLSLTVSSCSKVMWCGHNVTADSLLTLVLSALPTSIASVSFVFFFFFSVFRVSSSTTHLAKYSSLFLRVVCLFFLSFFLHLHMCFFSVLFVFLLS